MNYAKKILFGSMAVLIISLASAFLGYLIRLVLARSISPAEYGLFYAALSLFSLLAMFRTLGLNSYLAKYIPECIHRKNYSAIKGVIISTFNLQFMISGIVAILMIIFSDYLAIYYFHTQSASIVIKILALMFWIMPVEGLVRSIFQGFQKMYHYAIIEFVRMLITFILIILLLNAGFQAISPALSFAAGYLLISAIFMPSLVKLLPDFFFIRYKVDTKMLKKMISFGLPVMLSLFASYVLIYTDTIVLTYFRSLEDVALYQAASPTSQIVLYFGYALSAVLLPLSSEFWIKNRKEKLSQIIEMVYKYSIILILPATLLILSFPQLMLTVLFGEQYAAGYLALQILAAGIIFYTIANINSNILSGIGKPNENAKIVTLAAVINLVLNIIIIPKYGIAGAASSTFLSYMIILVLTTYKIRNFIRIRLPLWVWAKNLIAGIAFVGVIYFMKGWLDTHVLLEAVISVGVASIVYLVLILALGVITLKDIEFFKYALGMEKKFIEEE